MYILNYAKCHVMIGKAVFLVVLAVASVAPAAVEELLLNGDFETTPFGTDWTITSTAGMDHQGLTYNGLDASGTHAAYITRLSSNNYVRQTGFVSGPQWQLDFLFACEEVVVSATEDRSLNFAIPQYSAGQINMRVGLDGKLYVYKQGSGWQSLGNTTVNYSTDADDNGSFADAGDTLNVHSLRIVGNYGVASPYYDVYMSAANTTDYQLVAANVQSWQTANPSTYPYDFAKEVFFLSSAATGGAYVVDQVSFKAEIPEPITELINGDFEASPFDDGWINMKNTASVHRGLTAAGLDASGTQAALLQYTASNSALYQYNLDMGSRWQLDCLFASGAIASGGDRSFNLTVYSGGNGSFINLILGSDGTLSAYDINDTAWHQLSDKAVSFSSDGNGDGDFADAGDSLNVHSLRIIGNYEADSPYYNVYLSDANSEELELIAANVQYWHAIHPESGEFVNQLRFATGASEGVYLVDEVSLTEFEPGTLKPGDANGDTVVNAADAAMLAANWLKQTGAIWEEGDFNDDGKVDDKDATIMAANWTTTPSASVPEPAALVLLFIGGLALLPVLKARKY